MSDNYREELKSYVNLYLREEVMAEALVRKVDQFSRFLDVMALQNGEELHYQGLAGDSGVPARTIQNYVRILEDTLVGFSVPSFGATRKRKAITRSKFFLFDIGVVNFNIGGVCRGLKSIALLGIGWLLSSNLRIVSLRGICED